MDRWPNRKIRRAIGITMVAFSIFAAGSVWLLARAEVPELFPYVPLPGVLALGAVMAAGAGLGLILRLPRGSDRQPMRILSWWWVFAGVGVVITSTWISTAILLFLADASPDTTTHAQMRIDAVKTGLTVGAGAVGGVALLLGVRRQWLGERSQLHQEYDSTEKRVTELYTKAADQLGHEKAAVRLAGLYALERVANDNPEHRQTIVDVICAYLRMPPMRGADPGSRSAIDAQDLQVRLTAQRLLGKHLRWQPLDHRESGRF